MSYILDALRRLEQDRERSRQGMDPMEALLVPDRAGGRGFGGRRLLWVGTGVLVLVGAVLITYWVTRKSVDVPVVSSSPRSFHDVSLPLRSAPPPAAVSVRHRAARSGTPGRSTAGAISRHAEGSVSLGPDMRRATGSFVFSGHVGGSGDTANLAQGLVSTRSKSKLSAARIPSPMGGRVDRVGEQVRISAIAWSQSSKDRFAVVNLRTVREGDRVGDLLVYEIRQDGIVFQKGKQRYKVPLGTRE